jgi:hypothetical protein
MPNKVHQSGSRYSLKKHLVSIERTIQPMPQDPAATKQIRRPLKFGLVAYGRPGSRLKGHCSFQSGVVFYMTGGATDLKAERSFRDVPPWSRRGDV